MSGSSIPYGSLPRRSLPSSSKSASGRGCIRPAQRVWEPQVPGANQGRPDLLSQGLLVRARAALLRSNLLAWHRACSRIGCTQLIMAHPLAMAERRAVYIECLSPFHACVPCTRLRRVQGAPRLTVSHLSDLGLKMRQSFLPGGERRKTYDDPRSHGQSRRRGISHRWG